ncbi:TPA: site-specific DNA-methyltransferase [Burkholderia cepacia ATCC 25416]|uniref:DNA-methyltransferase n=1 Tax=Burkholderia cepacia TaxID=292 RepID=UPI001CF11B6A|nr:site-specific DNA-methyltransferase [Burkholderia cepacia]HDR9766571.1 site-specific DNA-methyltransferase [Burkholderia cepacia ATCC 25416]MCA8080741.1 site-specific DNA-methyltransferase [Burkholderia cepacia]MCA8321169.1 site-specific DNA-methyltransferase [Burkholderia cepacia]HDR9778221.1 site-specific DNA-methyltransferase [Burkholderia cepacia ATCC 25416]HDR9785852.1 site-specific DNA-methyltransferase [Burkholderia cepacia ATCC 25416]
MSSQVVVEQVTAILGKPVCSGEKFAIFHADCMEAMKALPAELVDLTVTSPPYNIGKAYESTMPLDEYVQWCSDWMNEVYRLTKSNGAFWLNVGYIPVEGRAKALPLPYLLWDKVPFFLIQELVWNYGAGVAARKFLSPRNEKFLWYVKDQENYTFNLDEIRDPDVKYPNQKKNGKLRCNTAGKNPSDVWQIAKVTSGARRSSAERAPHPAQFPMDLVDRLIKGFSNERELIMDPFMGSGTTAECAIRNGRYVIGFEKDRTYCDYIKQRLTSAENQTLSLFQLEYSEA